MTETPASIGRDRLAIARFLEMMAAEAGSSLNTLLAYGADLSAASAFLEGRLTEADTGAIERLAGEWATLKRSSVSRKSSALRRFFGFVVSEGDRTDVPSRALPPPGPQAEPKTMVPQLRSWSERHTSRGPQTGADTPGGEPCDACPSLSR